MKKSKKHIKKHLPMYQNGDFLVPDLGGGRSNPNDAPKKFDISQIAPYAGAAGYGVSMMSNIPGQQSNETGSAISGSLQGIGVGANFGIPGAILGGIGGLGMGLYNAKKRNIEQELAEQMKYNAYLSNSVVDPTKGIYKKGGKVKDKEFENTETYYSQLVKDKNDYIIPQMFGGLGDPKEGTPIIHIQAEDREKAIFGDGGIVNIKAKKKHEGMDSDVVTDVFPKGTYVASQRKNQAISKKKAEKEVLGHTPVVYNEFENPGEPEEVKFSDLYNKEEHTPADLATILQNKFKLLDKDRDVFTNVTNDENRIGRMPYLMKLIEMKEGGKSVQSDSSGFPEKVKKGGKVGKYDDGGMAELEKLYQGYGKQMTDFNNKYQQEYSDYYKYARGANAGANLLGAVGTGLQSSYINPGLQSNRYADQMFQKVPDALRRSGQNEAFKGVYSLGRNLSQLDIPTSSITGKLAPLVGNAINQNNQMQYKYNMDDVLQERGKGKFKQGIENTNLEKLANAENTTTRFDNYKIAQIAGFGGKALTGDATLAGKKLQTQMGLERNSIDSPFSMAAQLAQLRMQRDLMKKMGQGNLGGTDMQEWFPGSNSSNSKTLPLEVKPFNKMDSSFLGGKNIGSLLFKGNGTNSGVVNQPVPPPIEYAMDRQNMQQNVPKAAPNILTGSDIYHTDMNGNFIVPNNMIDGLPDGFYMNDLLGRSDNLHKKKKGGIVNSKKKLAAY